MTNNPTSRKLKRLSGEDEILLKELQSGDNVTFSGQQAAIEFVSSGYTVPARSGAD